MTVLRRHELVTRRGLFGWPSPPKPKRRALDVARRLARLYPDAECALNFRSPLELLIATILSAQCTDERVNIVTRDLFKRYRTAARLRRRADSPNWNK